LIKKSELKLLYFNYAVVLEYFLEMQVHGIKSHESLQFSKMTDHDHLTVEQRAKVVLFAKTKSVTTMQRRLQTISQTQWAPARNTMLHLFKTFAEEQSMKEEKRPHAPTVWSPEAVEAQP
jgi:hypothetical protein